MDKALSEAGLRPVARCDALGGGAYSESKTTLLRPYLTAAHRAALDMMTGWMTEAGMAARLDAMGNLIGRYEGLTPDAPALLIGSHIDTVPDGGRYDGALGVMIGLECAHYFSRRGVRFPFAIEIIAFGDEEGSRFPAAMLCSRAIATGVDSEVMRLADDNGVTLGDALRNFGLDPALAQQAQRAPGEILAYVEAHIEQGPVLETEDLPIGIVTGIAAQVRLRARFIGRAGHAGTTPMRLRSDALAAAAEGLLAVERICRTGAGDLVGTVGRLQSSTSAFNVIAGEAEIFIDVRAGDLCRRDAAAAEIIEALEDIARKRGVTVAIRKVHDLPGCPCDAALSSVLAEAVEAVGARPLYLMSGAGHDAMAVAALAPVAMLFIRCEGGVSHNSAESVTAEDTSYATRALIEFIERLGARHT